VNAVDQAADRRNRHIQRGRNRRDKRAYGSLKRHGDDSCQSSVSTRPSYLGVLVGLIVVLVCHKVRLFRGGSVLWRKVSR